ncbi:Arc family DNA-binding protein [Enterobacter hormaechei]|uniref:Arc family DNA-binding protein n=1 Tax=Enterobacter TaxID=547 RepID=UPI0005ED1C7C|nr:Arc family DNA-binding protein [Enterobacter hormaechei]EKS6306795.1 Arc family DNA-binding protein [Enterobacter hormaechei]EKS6351224.1 Arc family DNA-binding protein [Enterobacter hormaechei]EKW1918360.1 Arc family DNA-binding protein [Enterobacter hormaechei]EKW8983998.1 Arc family DNA-binding protein [Enterobacter hormaechei]EKY4831177.1 Arc family DNA-binding protein [Enterobacter hormaechei]
MSKFPSQEMDRFNVRLPAGMRDAIAFRAKKNGRSMNSEIIQILHDSLTGNALSMDDEFLKVFNEVTHSQPETIEEFDAVNEKVDWLIDKLMEKIDRESANVRALLQAKKNLSNKKPT